VVARYQGIDSEIYRTDQDGAITVVTDGETLRFWTFINGKIRRVDPVSRERASKSRKEPSLGVPEMDHPLSKCRLIDLDC